MTEEQVLKNSIKKVSKWNDQITVLHAKRDFEILNTCSKLHIDYNKYNQEYMKTETGEA